MERIQVTDEWLYKYMPAAAEALLEDMEREVDYKYEFSAGFEKRMKRLFRRERHMELWNAVHRVGRKCIHIAAVVMVLVFIFSMNIKAYRIAFFDTVRTAWEDSFLYRYMTDDGEKEEFAAHAPAYIPEGYIYVGENVNEFFSEYLYEDKAGVQLICQQEIVTDGKAVVYDNEYEEKTTLSLNGYTAEVYQYKDDTIYAYFEYGSCIYTIFAEELPVGDIRQIFLNWVWK